jgi:cytochrome c5
MPGSSRFVSLNRENILSHDREFFITFFSIMGGLAVFAIVLIIIASNVTSEVSDYKPEEIVVENIKPVGQVYVAGQNEPEEIIATEVVVADGGAGDVAAAEPRSGDQVYNSNCLACHATGAAGAPKLGDAAAWAPRIAKGMDSLLSNAINGLNAMPPKGLCMACSDAELQGAVEYMVSQSQ